MKLCNFRQAGVKDIMAGAVIDGVVVPLCDIVARSETPLDDVLIQKRLNKRTVRWVPAMREQWSQIATDNFDSFAHLALEDLELLPPVYKVPTFRDSYCFVEHVTNARAKRNLEVAPEWYEHPIFYFSNPTTIVGHEEPVEAPKIGKWLDYELEIACIIGREGRDISVDFAEEFIAGYTICNDWSLRDVQRQEMAVGLGPCKGKDFATSLGPWLVTPDELADRRSGKGYDLRMTAKVNGTLLSDNNWNTIHYSFAEMIARFSAGVTLYPGDVIGSGTTGRGCLLELGPQPNVCKGPDGWLGPGDVVELEIERLGVLRNRIV